MESVDPVIDEALEAGRECNPCREPQDSSGHGADNTDNGSVGDHRETDLAVGRAERSEHAQRPQPALRHDGEARGGDEADEQETHGLQREDDHRDGGLVRGRAASDVHCVPTGGARRLLAGGVEQDRHLSRRVGLARRDERELVVEVQGVLDHSDDVAGHAVRDEGIADLHVEGRRGIGRHRDVVRAGRETPGDEAECGVTVRPVRILRAQVDRVAGSRDRDALVVDLLDRAERTPAAATSARSVPTNVIEAVAVPMPGSSGSPALYARATPTVVAATANTISATTSTC